MTKIDVLDRPLNTASGYKVDVTRGERNGRVSSEWFSRPADERFLSLRIPMHSAHPYRFQTAHRSNLKSPTVPISNRPPF